MQHILDIIDEAPSDIYFKDSGKDVILRLVKDIQTVHNSVVTPNHYFNMGDGGAVVFIGNPEVERDEELIELANGLITLYLEARSGSVPDWVSHITEGQKNLGKAKEGKERRHVRPSPSLGVTLNNLQSGGESDDLLNMLRKGVEGLRQEMEEANGKLEAIVRQKAEKYGFIQIEADEEPSGLGDIIKQMLEKKPAGSDKERYRTPSGFEFSVVPEERIIRLVPNRQMYRPMNQAIHYCEDTEALYEVFFERLAQAKTVSQANKVWALFTTIINENHLESDDETELYVAKDASLFYLIFEREKMAVVIDPYARLMYAYMDDELMEAIKHLPKASEERLNALLNLEGDEGNLNNRYQYNALARIIAHGTPSHAEMGRVLKIFAAIEEMF